MRIHKGMGAPTFCRHRLKIEAQRQEISLTQLARRSGLSWERVRAYWVGRSRPTHDAMLALAKALETETAALLEVTC